MQSWKPRKRYEILSFSLSASAQCDLSSNERSCAVLLPSTQTLDKVLQAVQAAQAAQQGQMIHQAAAPGAGMVQESALISR